MNISKNAYSLLHSTNFPQKKVTSPSNFQANQKILHNKNYQGKNNFELDLAYNSEQLNETNLVSSNNITSRELSQKKIKHIETGRTNRSEKIRQILTNQTSMDPNICHFKSPQFPKSKMKNNESKKKIETIPFEICKGMYRSQKSASNLGAIIPTYNSKTIKNLVDLQKAKKNKRNSKRAVSRDSVHNKQRGSTKSVLNKNPKEVYNKHHRSFQKKKKLRNSHGKRKRALSSKEILLGSELNKHLNLKGLQGNLYNPFSGNQQMGLIYVNQNECKKVGVDYLNKSLEESGVKIYI